MNRRISMALPMLFAFIFAFSLVVSLNSPAVADPPPCCKDVKHCDGYNNFGECPRIDGVCQCNLIVGYCDPPAADCEPPP